MKYKIGDIFKIFDNFGYYVIYEVIPPELELSGWYRVNHLIKNISVIQNSQSFSGETFENKIRNLQIKFVGNLFEL